MFGEQYPLLTDLSLNKSLALFLFFCFLTACCNIFSVSILISQTNWRLALSQLDWVSVCSELHQLCLFRKKQYQQAASKTVSYNILDPQTVKHRASFHVGTY